MSNTERTAFRTIRNVSGDEYKDGYVKFYNVYQIMIQKVVQGERMKVANDQDGSFEAIEDILIFPVDGGVSSEPFHVEFYVKKEFSADDSQFLIEGIVKKQGAR